MTSSSAPFGRTGSAITVNLILYSPTTPIILILLTNHTTTPHRVLVIMRMVGVVDDVGVEYEDDDSVYRRCGW